MKKRILSMLLVIVLVLSVVPVSALAEEAGAQESVTAPAAALQVIQKNGKTAVKVGGALNLTAKMSDGSALGAVEWEASPAGSVNLTPKAKGVCRVEGVSAGDVTITAKANGQSQTFTLKVNGSAAATVPTAAPAPVSETVSPAIPEETVSAQQTPDTNETVPAQVPENTTPAADIVASGEAVVEGDPVETADGVPKTMLVLDSSMPDTMLAGEELVLKAELVKVTNPNKKFDVDITWKLKNESDGDFCRIDKNTLDTKSDLLGKREITLVASVEGTKYSPESLEYTVTVIPRVSSITLKVGDQIVNNKTCTVNVLNGESVTINAAAAPEEAEQDVVWEITGGAGIFDKTESPSALTLEPNGTNKSGEIKVTAVAMDGTKVSATTTIRFVKLGESELEKAPTQLRGGASLDLGAYLKQDADWDDKTVTWGFEDNSNVVNGKKIASIDKNTGKLTTKPVTDITDITITWKGTLGVLHYHTITLYPATKSIIISGAPKTIEFGEQKTFWLDAEVKPAALVDDYGNPVWDLTWSSTNENVATVKKNGLLTIKGPGKVRIDCTTTDGSKIKGSVNLEVISTANTVNVTPKDKALASGESLDMKAVITTPTGRKAANQSVSWSIADEYGNATNAASISSTGRVTAKNVEKNTAVVVTATSKADKEVFGTASLIIKASSQKTLHVRADNEFVKDVHTMNVGDSCVLDAMWQKSGKNVTDASMKPANDCQFFSNNTGVATIDQELGMLTAVGRGSAVITARWQDPDTNELYTTTFQVTVTDMVASVTIGLPNNFKYLRSNQGVQLSATAWTDISKNLKAANQSFDWEAYLLEGGVEKKSDDVKISANGYLSVGTVDEKTTVRAKAVSKENGRYAWVDIDVYPADQAKLSFQLDGTTYENIMPVDYDNGLAGLKVYFRAVTTSNGVLTIGKTKDVTKKIEWASSNSNVIAVSKDKKTLTIKSVGKTELTANYHDGSAWRSAKITVNVNRPVGSVTIEQVGVLVSGKSVNMRIKAENSNATNQNVIWSVSDTTYATINQYTGLLKAKSGIHVQKTVTVNAKPVDGSNGASLPVTIYPATTKVLIMDGTKNITGTKVTKTLKDAPFTVTAEAQHVYKENGVEKISEAYSGAFKWTSSNKSVAEVDAATGLVTIKGKGSVTIKAIAQDGTNKTAKFTLRVTN